MDVFGEIEIKIGGSVGARKSTPELVDIDEIRAEAQIDFLHERSAVAIESLQRLAVEKDYVVTVAAC